MKSVVALLLLIAPMSALALTDGEIAAEAAEKANNEWFPDSVKVKKTYDFKFFPGEEDTEYSRFGSICGKVDVYSSGKSATLIIISDVEEENGRALIGTPLLYDIERDPGPARSALSKKCKSPR